MSQKLKKQEIVRPAFGDLMKMWKGTESTAPSGGGTSSDDLAKSRMKRSVSDRQNRQAMDDILQPVSGAASGDTQQSGDEDHHDESGRRPKRTSMANLKDEDRERIQSMLAEAEMEYKEAEDLDEDEDDSASDEGGMSFSKTKKKAKPKGKLGRMFGRKKEESGAHLSIKAGKKRKNAKNAEFEGSGNSDADSDDDRSGGYRDSDGSDDDDEGGFASAQVSKAAAQNHSSTPAAVHATPAPASKPLPALSPSRPAPTPTPAKELPTPPPASAENTVRLAPTVPRPSPVLQRTPSAREQETEEKNVIARPKGAPPPKPVAAGNARPVSGYAGAASGSGSAISARQNVAARGKAGSGGGAAAAAHVAMAPLLKQHGNSVCADCSSQEVRFVAVRIGVFLCSACAGVHRTILGPEEFAAVRPLNDEYWDPKEIDFLRAHGNEVVNARLEAELPAVAKPSNMADGAVRAQFIHMKYAAAFRAAAPAPAVDRADLRAAFASLLAEDKEFRNQIRKTLGLKRAHKKK